LVVFLAESYESIAFGVFPFPWSAIFWAVMLI
jgi:hypothetical protein